MRSEGYGCLDILISKLPLNLFVQPRSEDGDQGEVVGIEAMTLRDALAATARSSGDDLLNSAEGFDAHEASSATWRIQYSGGTFPAFTCPPQQTCGSQDTAVFVIVAHDGKVCVM